MNQQVFLGMVIVVGTLALIMAFVAYQIRNIEWLKRHGRPIVAVVTSIRHETGKTPAGFSRDLYYVTARWTNPRTRRTYTLWTWVMNSCPVYSQGELIPVLIDPNNPNRFTMDF